MAWQAHHDAGLRWWTNAGCCVASRSDAKRAGNAGDFFTAPEHKSSLYQCQETIELRTRPYKGERGGWKVEGGGRRHPDLCLYPPHSTLHPLLPRGGRGLRHPISLTTLPRPMKSERRHELKQNTL